MFAKEGSGLSGRDGGGGVAAEQSAENDELREASCRLENTNFGGRVSVQYCVCRLAVALVSPLIEVVPFPRLHCVSEPSFHLGTALCCCVYRFFYSNVLPFASNRSTAACFRRG